MGNILMIFAYVIGNILVFFAYVMGKIVCFAAWLIMAEKHDTQTITTRTPAME